MTFEKGGTKPAGSGRQKGTRNKRSNKVLDLFSDHDYDPLVEAIKMLQQPFLTEEQRESAYKLHVDNCHESYDEPKSRKEFFSDLEETMLTPKEILDGHLKLAKYAYPILKAVELKAEDGKPVPVFNLNITPPESK